MDRGILEERLRSLLKILLGGLAAFMVLAIAEERDFFYAAWIDTGPEAPVLSKEERTQAAEAVGFNLRMMRHYYSSGGDPRFAERFSASEGILAELRADVEYLGRNHRLQDPRLEQLEVLSVEPLDARVVEVLTRELWRVRVLWATSGKQAEPDHIQVSRGRYVLSRGSRGWRIESWDPLEASIDR